MLAGMGRTWRMCAGGMLCTWGRAVDRVWVDVVGSVTVANRDCVPSLPPLLVLVEVLLVIVGFGWGPPAPPLAPVDAVVVAAAAVPLPEEAAAAAAAPLAGGFPPALI